MNDQDSLWDGLTLVAGEPIWEDWVWGIFAKLWKNGYWDSSIFDIFNESAVLELDQGVEFFSVLVV